MNKPMTREELKEWIDKEWAARQKEAWESYVDHQKTRALEMGKAYENGYFAGAAAEREACAKLCEDDGMLWGARYAAKIRAGGVGQERDQ